MIKEKNDFLKKLENIKIVYQETFARSIENELYVWGGAFHTPHRIKNGKLIDIVDIKISRGGYGCFINKEG